MGVRDSHPSRGDRQGGRVHRRASGERPGGPGAAILADGTRIWTRAGTAGRLRACIATQEGGRDAARGAYTYLVIAGRS